MFIRLAWYRDEKFLLPRNIGYSNVPPREISLWTPGLQLKGLLYLKNGFQTGDYLPVDVLKYADGRDANVVALLPNSEYTNLYSLLSVPPEKLV